MVKPTTIRQPVTTQTPCPMLFIDGLAAPDVCRRAGRNGLSRLRLLARPLNTDATAGIVGLLPGG